MTVTFEEPLVIEPGTTPEVVKLQKVVALLLHRCGGICTIVRGDFQAIQGKEVKVVGQFGNTITLELLDAAPS